MFPSDSEEPKRYSGQDSAEGWGVFVFVWGFVFGLCLLWFSAPIARL